MLSSKKITILGATGSIGESTLSVVSQHPERYEVFALTAFRQVEKLAQLVQRFKPSYVVVGTSDAAQAFRDHCAQLGLSQLPAILIGEQGLIEVATHEQVDMVMAAIVGAAGLPSALAAAYAGKRILLANKEALVVAGRLFMKAVETSGASLLPIDSEHNAIFQSLPKRDSSSAVIDTTGVTEIILTASGGPFLKRPLDEFAHITPDQACAHPNWSMGRKISVDSATMMNKGLEVIEAHWLFSTPAEKISVVIHPQSVIHSMVEYADGSILAQLGSPDMRTPIAYGMAYPERISAGVKRLKLAEITNLQFFEPDFKRFPCLRLAFDALKSGQESCIVLNAANEVAVDLFLQQQISYLSIASLVERTLAVMQGTTSHSVESLDELLALDQQTRAVAREQSKRITSL